MDKKNKNPGLSKEQKERQDILRGKIRIFCTDFGKHIERIRRRHGKSQDRLCLEAGMSRAALSRIEAGKVDPQISTLQRIAEVLNIPLSELTGVRKRGGWFSE